MKQLRSKAYLAVIIAFMAIMAVTVSGCTKAKEKEPEVIKIGAILPLTGNLGFIGEEEKNAFDMILKETNKHGKKIEIVYGDSKGSAKEGVALFNKLVDVNKSRIIITSTSSVTNAILPIAKNKDIVLFAITIQPDVTEGYENVFRIWPNSLEEWELLFKHLKKTDLKRFGLYYSAGDFGLLSKEYFETKLPEVNKELVYSEMVKIGEKNINSMVVKHKAENIDGVLIMCYPGDTLNIVKKLRENNIGAPLFSYLTFTYDFLRKGVAKEAEGTIFTSPAFSVVNSKESEDFVQEYTSLFNKEPNWNSAFSYDLISFIGYALNNYTGPVNRNELIKKFENIRQFNGVTGVIEILPNHDTKVDLQLAVLHDGEITAMKKE